MVIAFLLWLGNRDSASSADFYYQTHVAFLFVFIFPCCVLPAITSLSLGEFPAHSRLSALKGQASAVDLSFRQSRVNLADGVLRSAYSGLQRRTAHPAASSDNRLVVGLRLCTPMGIERSTAALPGLPPAADSACLGGRTLKVFPGIELYGVHVPQRPRLPLCAGKPDDLVQHTALALPRLFLPWSFLGVSDACRLALN